jgi:hypothetical protein
MATDTKRLLANVRLECVRVLPWALIVVGVCAIPVAWLVGAAVALVIALPMALLYPEWPLSTVSPVFYYTWILSWPVLVIAAAGIRIHYRVWLRPQFRGEILSVATTELEWENDYSLGPFYTTTAVVREESGVKHELEWSGSPLVSCLMAEVQKGQVRTFYLSEDSKRPQVVSMGY